MAGSHGSSLPAPGTLTADATAPLMQLERRLRPEAYGHRRGGYIDRRRTPGRRLMSTGATFDDLRDHNPNRPLASSQVLELEGRRPAVSLDRWQPLATVLDRCGTDPARTGAHGTSSVRETIRVTEWGRRRSEMAADLRDRLTVGDRGRPCYSGGSRPQRGLGPGHPDSM
jgi:hypothetical protein